MGEQLDKLCVYYMAIGVPYDVFWYGDYCSLKYYERVYLQKRKVANEEMWMQGMYDFIAHQTTLGNAFRGKGQSAQKYLEKPLEFFGKTEEEQKAEEERLKQRIIDNLNAFKKAWDLKNGRISKDSTTSD